MRRSPRKRHHLTGINPEAAFAWRLFARFEKRLQAEADAEKRNAGANTLDQCVANLKIVEGAHHLAEVANAG